MLKFVTKTPRGTLTPSGDLIKWIQPVPRPGTTALIDTNREARVGSFITHKDLNKVELIAKSSAYELTVKFLAPHDKVGEVITVKAADCGPPFSNPVKLLNESYIDIHLQELRRETDYWNDYEATCYKFYLHGPSLSSKAMDKRNATNELVTAEGSTEAPAKRPLGRPLGSKDKLRSVR